MRVLAAFWGFLTLGAPAAAQDAAPERVVLLRSRSAPERPALEPSLRIQLRGLDLTTLDVDFPPDLPSRLHLASEIARERAADWVVWSDDVQTEADASASQAVLYVVGRRDGRALIEVVRVPGGEGPEVDRSLALKVRELIGVRDGAAFALGVREIKESDDRRVTLLLELGAQLGDGGSAGLSPDAFIALGPRLITPAFVISVPLEVGYGFTRRAERDGARVEWTEVSASGGVRLLARVHPFVHVGGSISGKLAFTDAEGTSASGRTGTSTERLPALALSLDAELPFSHSFAARLALGLELRSQRQRFLVEGREIADTGRTVPQAKASLVWQPW